MSRSYRLTPMVKDSSKGRRHGSRSMKNFANKKVRRRKDLPTRQKGAYKKVSESYDICDYSFKCTKEDAIRDWEEEEKAYPRIKSYFKKDEVSGEWIKEYRIEEEGFLHWAYGTLEKYLIHWSKVYKWK